MTAALVVAKDFRRAKTRLAPVLGGSERALLAREWLGRVLGAARRCPAVATVAVATDSDEVASIAREAGARALRDRPGARSLGRIVDAALEDLAGRAIVLMSDLPLVEPADLAAVARLLDEAPIVVAPDRRRESTNALGLALPPGIRTAFGTPGSFSLHLGRAAEAGLAARVYEHERVALDVDTPEDWEGFTGAPPAGASS